MDPMTLMALASMAFGVIKQDQMAGAAKNAAMDASADAGRKQNEVLKSSYGKRREAQGAGTVLGGQASKEGSILSSSQNQKSLLG